MVAINRMQRIAEQLRHELGKILLREIDDPRLKFISLTTIEVAKDMSHAKVFFTVTGQTHEVVKIEQTLNKAGCFMRTRLATELNLRVTPKLRFIHDNTVEAGRQLAVLIDQAIATDKKRAHKEG